MRASCTDATRGALTIKDGGSGVILNIVDSSGHTIFAITTSFGFNGYSNHTSFTTGLSGINAIPADSSKPQITDGFTTFSTIFTPKSPVSIITLQANLQVAHTIGGAIMVCSIFANGAIDAVATNYVIYDNGATSDGIISIGYVDKSFSGAARSYKIRCGTQGAGTLYINLFENGTAVYGGTETSYLFIEEVIQ